MSAKEKLNTEIEKLQKELKETECGEDLEAIKKGYKYKVCGWVHSSSGEDDYQIKFYLPVKPKKAHHKFFRDTFKNAGSAVLDDYRVIELNPEHASN